MARRTAPPRLMRRGAALRLIGGGAGIVLLYYLIPFDRNGLDTSGGPWQIVIAAVVFVLLVVLMGRQARYLVVDHGRSARFEALIFLILVVVLFFSLIYVGLAREFSGLDTKTDALYFTVSTLATVGFGDVHAVGQPARAVVTVQIAFDLGYIAALASLITGVMRQRVAGVRERTLPQGSGEPGQEPGQPGQGSGEPPP